jgi:hypothetical protein
MKLNIYITNLLALMLSWSLPLMLNGAAPAPEPSGILQGTIVDAATGLQAPCTVTIIDSRGNTVTERASLRSGFRSNGQFEKRVPAGKTLLRVTRGFETRAVERIIDVPAGGVATAEVKLERTVDLRKRGWFSGDSHAHMIHGERTIPVDFDYVALAARAEDLQYLSLSHAWTLDDPTPEKLESELGPRSTPDCVLTWNLEAPKNYYLGDAGRCLGHCWTLGMRGRTEAGDDVIQLLLRASAHDYESDKPTYANFESHQLIRSQGGAVFYTHPARWWTGAWGGQGGYPRQERMRISNLAVELPLDTVIGPTYDGLDIITGSGEFKANEMAFELWALLLNNGYRLAGTASSDACFDRPGGATPGVVRTYTYLDEEFSLPAVARATSKGRTFVSSGPLLLVSLDGQPPGSAFLADGQARALRIEAWASGADAGGLTRLEILRNGKPLQSTSFSSAVATVTTNIAVNMAESGWYCVRVFGSDPQRQRAISGAFFIDDHKHQPPAPAPARIRLKVQDAASGEPLSGTVTEVTYLGELPRDGQKHVFAGGESTLIVPATVRVRVEAAGYEPAVQSPFLNNPALVDFITGLAAEDLLDWATFEQVRRMLGETALTFRMNRSE